MNIINLRRTAGQEVAGLLGALLLIVGVPAALAMATADGAGAATSAAVPGVSPSALATSAATTARAASTSAVPALSPATPATPAVPAASCPEPDLCSTSLQGDAASVKTSNGVSWLLSVSGLSNQVTVELAREASTTPVAYEIHGWTLPVTSGGLSFSASTGVGTIDPGTDTSPVATVDVTFHSTASKVIAGACTTGSETEYHGTLSGSVQLVTGMTGGGTVSSSSFDAPSSHPIVTVYKDCVVPNKCLPSSIGFDEDPSPLANPNLAASGITGTFSGTSEDQVTVADDSTLTTPAGADRVDESLLQAAPATWTPSTKTLVVTTEPSGLITGSVTIVGSKKSSTSIPCTKGGKSVHNVLTFYDKSSWTSPAGQALTANDDLGGDLVMPLANTKAEIFLSSTK